MIYIKLNKILYLLSLVAVFFITSCNDSDKNVYINTPFEEALNENYDFIEKYIEENNINNIRQFEYEKNLLLLGETEEEIKIALIGLENEKLIITNEEVIDIQSNKEVVLKYIINKDIRIAVVVTLNNELKKETDKIEIELTENSEIRSMAITPVKEGIAVFDDKNSDKNKDFIVKSIHLKKDNQEIYKVILN